MIEGLKHWKYRTYISIARLTIHELRQVSSKSEKYIFIPPGTIGLVINPEGPDTVMMHAWLPPKLGTNALPLIQLSIRKLSWLAPPVMESENLLPMLTVFHLSLITLQPHNITTNQLLTLEESQLFAGLRQTVRPLKINGLWSSRTDHF